jgi:hypothetical protein
LVVIVRSKPHTPINEFLNQRLPDKLPNEQNLLPVGHANYYGYFSYNPQALQAYLKHVGTVVSDATPSLSARLMTLTPLLESDRGYISFVSNDGETAPRVFHYGNWNSTSGSEFVFAQEAAFHPTVALGDISLKQSFMVGDTPVWRMQMVTPDKSNNAPDKKTDPSTSTSDTKNLLYALDNGDLISAAAPEALTEFLQDLTPPTTETNTLGKSFNHLPTICFQAKYKMASLMQTLLRQTPSSPEAGKENLYAAGSLGQGQLGLTFDVPYEFLTPVIEIMSEPTKDDDAKPAATTTETGSATIKKAETKAGETISPVAE